MFAKYFNVFEEWTSSGNEDSLAQDLKELYIVNKADIKCYKLPNNDTE